MGPNPTGGKKKRSAEKGRTFLENKGTAKPLLGSSGMQLKSASFTHKNRDLKRKKGKRKGESRLQGVAQNEKLGAVSKSKISSEGRGEKYWRRNRLRRRAGKRNCQVHGPVVGLPKTEAVDIKKGKRKKTTTMSRGLQVVRQLGFGKRARVDHDRFFRK